MDILGDRKFVEIPGERQHELPPLIVHRAVHLERVERVVSMAEKIADAEDLIPAKQFLDPKVDLDSRRMDLAINMVEQYRLLLLHWHWGDDILEWIRQCEITFGYRQDLRHLLRADVWPHAGRSSFVQLLEDKSIPTNGVQMEKAVGLRLTFRRPPPIDYFTNQFLFYLYDSVGPSAYGAWASKNPAPVSDLPPERFTLHVQEM